MEQQDLLSTSSSQYNQQNLPNATAALVLGIISIVSAFCYGLGLIFAIIGLVMANKDRKLYRDSPENYSPASYGTLNAGRVCSIIGICLASLVILIVIFLVMIAASLSPQLFKS